MILPFTGKGLIRSLLLFSFLFHILIQSGHGATLTWKRTMMKTSMEMILCGPHEGILESAAEKAFREIKRIEEKLSPLNEGSVIFKVNKNAGIQGVRTDPEVLALLQEAIRFSALSQGCFDITVQGLANLWDFHLSPFLPPDKDIVRAHLPLVNYRKIRVDESRSLIFLKKKGMKIKGYRVTQNIKFSIVVTDASHMRHCAIFCAILLSILLSDLAGILISIYYLGRYLV